ncbi:MAG: NAD(+) diphosphatase [Ilumatobacteraceae bacterium]
MPRFTPGFAPGTATSNHSGLTTGLNGGFDSGATAATSSGAQRYFHVIGSSVFVSDKIEVEEAAAYFIGMLDDEVSIGCWAIDVPAGRDPSDGAALDLYSFFGRAGEQDWIAAGRAVQIAEWARTNRFCGRCGVPTEAQPNERAMKCPSCGLLAYPRVAPAMITLVTRGEPGPEQEALLARGVQFRGPMYSCLAGFVEPGESLEGAVVREVREEVGFEVGNVRYQASQPWPFPHSLMVGFRADWAGGDIVCDPSEILDAQWFRRDSMPNIPPRISIARQLIDTWLAEPQ